MQLKRCFANIKLFSSSWVQFQSGQVTNHFCSKCVVVINVLVWLTGHFESGLWWDLMSDCGWTGAVAEAIHSLHFTALTPGRDLLGVFRIMMITFVGCSYLGLHSRSDRTFFLVGGNAEAVYMNRSTNSSTNQQGSVYTAPYCCMNNLKTTKKLFVCSFFCACNLIWNLQMVFTLFWKFSYCVYYCVTLSSELHNKMAISKHNLSTVCLQQNLSTLLYIKKCSFKPCEQSVFF